MKRLTQYLLAFLLLIAGHLCLHAMGVKHLGLSHDAFSRSEGSGTLMRITTKKTAPESWFLVIDAKSEDRNEVWLDYNGNGICDPGEKPAPKEFGGFMMKPIVSSTLAIYGKVTVLECQDNSITSLDLLNNPFLEELNCGQNLLTQVDLSQNPALKIVAAYGMDLTSLDLSHNPLLENVKCYGNLLTSLDLSNNPMLTAVSCDENKLASLDLSHQAKLKTLMAHHNQLTSIDLTVCSELENVTLYENQLETLTLGNLPKLNNLYAYSNQLASINLEGCPQLMYLSIGMNRLTTLDLSHNPRIVDIFCPINCLGDEAITALVAQLPDRSNEQERGKLYIIDTDITPSDQNFCSKENVDIATAKHWTVYDYRQGKNNGANPYSGATRSNLYTTDQPKCILTSSQTDGAWELRIDANIGARETAWIDRNGDGKYQQGEEIKDWDQDTKILRTTSQLTIYGDLSKLYCSKNELTALDVSELSKLRQLAARDNNLQTLDLSQNKNLVELFCYNNRLSALHLENNPNLIRVDCEKNQLSSLDLSKNKLLEQVYCHQNRLIELDLRSNTLLNRFNCAENKIEKIFLSPNNQIYIINCHSNALSEKETENIVSALYDCSSAASKGILVAVDTTNPDEKNLWSIKSVEQAKSRNWVIYNWQNGANDGKNPYAGENQTSIIHRERPFTVAGLQVIFEPDRGEPVLLYALSGELLAIAEGNELTLPYEGAFVLQVGKTSYIITATRL